MAPRTRCLPWFLFFVVLHLVNISSATEDAHTQCDGVNALSPSCHSRESLHYRDFFYIGGRYTKGDSGPTTGTVLVDQVYVEKLTPAFGVRQPRPVVFVHPGGRIIPSVHGASES